MLARDRFDKAEQAGDTLGLPGKFHDNGNLGARSFVSHPQVEIRIDFHEGEVSKGPLCASLETATGVLGCNSIASVSGFQSPLNIIRKL